MKEALDDERRLEGVCTLRWANGADERVRCRFDLVKGWFTCDRDVEATSALDAFESDQPEILDLEIVTPAGVLASSRLQPSFVVSRGGGRLSVADTSSGMLSGVFGKPSQISFIFNDSIEFVSNREAHEIMFVPGFDTGNRIKLTDQLTLVGSKITTTIVGDWNGSYSHLQRTLSIALGAEVHRCLSWQDNNVKLWLNSFDFRKQPRPFVSVGGRFKEIKTLARNIETIFRLALDYFGRLSDDQASKADNAIRSLLDARSSSTNYFSGVLCIFHFLEWFDGSRTMSANTLMPRLGISRAEAETLISLRNAVVHGNVEPDLALSQCYSSLSSLASTAHPLSDKYTRAGAILDYLHTIVGNALIRELGYEGETRSFL